MARVTDQVAGQLVREGYLISPKSQPDPVESVAWMGKDVGAGAGRIAPRPTAIADRIARWVRLATRPCITNAVIRIQGRLEWLGRPGNTASPFWARTRAWVHHGPRWAPRTPPAMVAGMLEGLAVTWCHAVVHFEVKMSRFPAAFQDNRRKHAGTSLKQAVFLQR